MFWKKRKALPLREPAPYELFTIESYPVEIGNEKAVSYARNGRSISNISLKTGRHVKTRSFFSSKIAPEEEHIQVSRMGNRISVWGERFNGYCANLLKVKGYKAADKDSTEISGDMFRLIGIWEDIIKEIKVMDLVWQARYNRDKLLREKVEDLWEKELYESYERLKFAFQQLDLEVDMITEFKKEERYNDFIEELYNT